MARPRLGEDMLEVVWASAFPNGCLKPLSNGVSGFLWKTRLGVNILATIDNRLPWFDILLWFDTQNGFSIENRIAYELWCYTVLVRNLDSY